MTLSQIFTNLLGIFVLYLIFRFTAAAVGKMMEPIWRDKYKL